MPARRASVTAQTELLSEELAQLASRRARTVQVTVIEGPDLGRTASLSVGDLMTIGTANDATLQLTDDRVSRRHARLSASQANGELAIEIEDLKSRNGTLVDGTRVSRAELRLGATLKVGKTSLRLSATPQRLNLKPSEARRFGELWGDSLAMRELFALLERLAESDATVLLEGETGVGKELAARALHEQGPRHKGPFVAIDCSALPENLLESELFGHLRGAFTGATEARKGAFVRADGGTLLLDELATISLAVQARLLRVLEERKVRAVGADQERAVDVRVIATTREPLAPLVARGAFRSDLLYRLSVVHLVVPPLRNRREDVGPMLRAMLVRAGKDAGKGEPFDPKGPALDALTAHAWPGNARELRNQLDRALALNPRAQRFEELPFALDAVSDDGLPMRLDVPFSDAKDALLRAFERRYLSAVMARSRGNQSEAARMAGLDRKYFRELCLKHGLK
jgi:DNA-binding NtrC family response regulator